MEPGSESVNPTFVQESIHLQENNEDSGENKNTENLQYTQHVDSESPDTIQKRRGRPKLLKKYLKEWEDEDRFKEWIREIPGDSSIAFCRFCMATIRANVKDLENHATFKKHKLRMASYSKMADLINDEDKENNENLQDVTMETSTADIKNVGLLPKVKYKRKWESQPEFMDWIRSDVHIETAVCCYCDVVIAANERDLLEHAQSNNHQDNIPAGLHSTVGSARVPSKKDKDFVYEDDEQYNYVDPNPYIPQADESMILERNELEFEVLNIKRNVVQLQKQKLQLEIKKLEIELNKMQGEMKISPAKPGGTLRGVRRTKVPVVKSVMPSMKVMPKVNAVLPVTTMAVSALPDVTKVNTVLPAITTAFTSAQLQGNTERTIQIITHADLDPTVTSASQDFTGLPTVSAPVAIPVSYEVPAGETVVTVSYEPSAESEPTYTYTASTGSEEPISMPSMPSLSPWHDYSNSTNATIIS